MRVPCVVEVSSVLCRLFATGREILLRLYL